MNREAAFTIEKIPLRLSLVELSSQACLTYSQQYHFTSRGESAFQHPLMYRIDEKGDCRSIALSLGEKPVALIFYHYREKGEKSAAVVFHSLMVMPHLRGRGLARLLVVHALSSILTPSLQKLTIESEFPTPFFPSALFPEGKREECRTLEDREIEELKKAIKAEEESHRLKVLKSLVEETDFIVPLARKEVVVAVFSDSSRFFDGIWALAWPPFLLLKPVQLGSFKEEVPSKHPYDLLLYDGAAINNHRDFFQTFERKGPDLPKVIVGGKNEERAFLHSSMEELLPQLENFLRAHEPHQREHNLVTLRKNILRLPEKGKIEDYRGRHKGERLFIAASGPSLMGVESHLLSSETIMTINDAIKHFPGSRYAAVMDSRKLHELYEELLPVEALFTLEGNSYGVEVSLLGPEGFSLDLAQGIYSGYTTAYFSLQLAIYMGFREIYYLGLDLGNTSRQSHFFGTRALQDRDRPEVYGQMRRSFEQVSRRVKALGVEVYNCSPVSELKAFPFRPLSQVVGGEERLSSVG